MLPRNFARKNNNLKAEMKKKLFAAAIGLAVLSGCASIQSGTTQQVKISSNPEGADVYIAIATTKDNQVQYLNKVKVGQTPTTVRLSRKDGAVILEKEGFQQTIVPLNRTMNPWVWGDILLTSPLSTSIDTSTGAANEYDPGEYMVDMKPATK